MGVMSIRALGSEELDRETVYLVFNCFFLIHPYIIIQSFASYDSAKNERKKTSLRKICQGYYLQKMGHS